MSDEAVASGWKNGDTALSYIYDQMGNSVKAMESASARIKKSLDTPFNGCPSDGIEFHRAIGDAAIAQNTAITALTTWNQKHVCRAIKVEQSNQRRATGNPNEVPEIDYQGVFGHLVARGKGSMTPIIKFILIVVLGVCLIYGIRAFSRMQDNMTKMSDTINRVGKVLE